MFSDYTKQMLRLYGDEVITDLKILRNPIQPLLLNILSLLSLGRLEETLHTLGYDEFFHTTLLINHTYVLDRWCSIRLRVFDGNLKGKEILPVNLPPTFKKTIKEFLKTTRLSIGKRIFYDYHIVNNNCQDFVMQSLLANMSPINKQMEDFVKQHTEVCTEKIPYLCFFILRFIIRILIYLSNVSWNLFKFDIVNHM